MVTIRPGKPFWSATTAFAANMVALFGVDQIDVTVVAIEVRSWFAAVLVSSFVALAVYAKAKADELTESKAPPVP